jgi:hypothetical protein
MGQPDGEHIGKVEIDVVPNAAGFARALKREIDSEADKAGRDLGETLAAPVGKEVAAAVLDGVKDGAKKARPAADKAGRDVGATFAEHITKAIKSGVSDVGDVKVKVTPDASEFSRTLEHDIKSQRDVKVRVTPDVRAFSRSLKHDIDSQGLAVDLGRSITAPIGKNVAAGLLRGLGNAVELVADVGDDVADGVGDKLKGATASLGTALKGVITGVGEKLSAIGGDFGARLRDGLGEVLQNLPEAEIEVDDDAVAGSVASIRAQLQAISDKHIGVDITVDEAMDHIQLLRTQLSALAREVARLSVQRPEITVDVDALNAMATLTRLHTELQAISGVPVEVDVGVQLHTAAFVAAISAVMAASQTLIPDLHVTIELDAAAATARLAAFAAFVSAATIDRTVNIDADVLAAATQLAALDAALTYVSLDRTVNIDADVMAAVAQLAALDALLQMVTRDRTIHIRIEVDTGAAEAQLAGLAVAAEAATLGRTLAIDADTGGARTQLATLSAATALATRDRTINVDADIAPVIASLVTASVAARSAAGGGAELGASLTAANIPAGLLSVKMAGIALGGIAIGALLIPALGAAVVLMGALAAAAGVVVAAFAVLAIAAVPIIAAIQAVGKAEDEADKKSAQNAARAQQRAAQEKQRATAIANARRGVAQASQQAAQAEEAADRRIIDAHKQVVQATKDLAAAEKAVNDAREEARRESEDLASQVEHNAQDQRQNALDQQESLLALQKVMADPAATAEQREQAQLNYDRLTLQNKDLETQAARLAEKQKAEAKNGIEGSDQVVAAKDRVKKAEQALEDRRAAQKQAQQERDRAITQGAQQVADAQRALTAAQEKQITAVTATGTAAADAQKKLAKLTKESKALVTFLRGIDFGPLVKAAQGFTGPLLAGLKGFIPAMMPTLTKFVGDVSSGIGDSMKVFFDAFKSPFWKQFFGALGGFAKDALPGFAKGMTDAARGVAGLIEAFLPSSKIVGGGVLKMLEDFADWAEGLKGNPEFQQFIAYALSKLPVLWEIFKNLGKTLVNMGKGLAPIGDLLLDLLNTIMEWLASIKPETWTAIAVAVGVVLGAFLAFKGVAVIMKLVTSAIAIFQAVVALVATPVGLIIVAIVALVAAFVYFFNTNKGFHDFVIEMWNKISEAIQIAWTEYIKPALEWLWQFIIVTLVPALLWFWHNVIVPLWGAVVAAIQTAWALIQPYLVAFWQFITLVLVPIFMFLWHNVVEPAWMAISFVIGVAWAIIKVILYALWLYISKFLVPIFMFLWQKVIVPVWAGIRVAISVAWKLIEIIFTAIKIFIEGVLGPIFEWLHDHVVKPVFEKIHTAISTVWGKIKPLFEQLGTFLEEKVKPPFERGVAAIGGAFDKLRDFFRIPIKFVVNTVFNDGLIHGMNWIAKALHVEGVDIKPIPLPQGFATGGPVFGAGTKTSDSILARLSDGEHVWTADEVTAVGGHGVMRQMRKLAVTGMLDEMIKSGGGAGFATGGPVTATGMLAGVPGYASGGGIVKSGWDALTGAVDWAKKGIKGAAGLVADFTNKAITAIGDPGSAVRALAGQLVKLIPNQDTVVGKIMVGMPETALRFMSAKFNELRAAMTAKTDDGSGAAPWTGTLSPVPILKSMQEFALAQRGKRYQWAAAGPSTYDCCIVAGVRIYGPDGVKPIEDVRAGDRVYSYVDGKLEPHTVTKAWQSIHQPVFNVRTRNRTVTASANHPFLRIVQTGTEQVQKLDDADWPGVITGRYGNNPCSVSTCETRSRSYGLCRKHAARYEHHGDPRVAWVSTRATFGTEWARVDELRRGDLLVQPRVMPTEPQDTPTLADGTVVDADVAWLIGAAVGDGTVTDASLRLCMYGQDRERATAVIRDRWGGNPSHGASYGLVASSMRLARALADLGMRRLGPDKRMPQAVWSWEPALQRAFLDGYCDADGHRPADTSRHGERTYHSASRELIEDVRALHLVLGDPASNITVTRRTKPIVIKGKQVVNALDQHSFSVWPRSTRAGGEARLREAPGLAEWLDGGDFTVAPVLGVDAAGEQDTWDLTVEDAHNFIADGLVVHNSGLVGNLWAIATKNKLYRRYMSTSNMGPGRHGMVAGPGRFTVYLSRSGGHTAANIDGLHAEAYGGNGTPLAIGHRGTRLSYYNERLHLPGLAGGGPVSITTMNDDERLMSFLERGWPEPPVKLDPRALQFDAGGLLFDTTAMPGQVMPVYHSGSKPDAVLTDQQWRDLHANAQQGAPARAGLSIENYHERGAEPGQVARDLDWLSRGLG